MATVPHTLPDVTDAQLAKYAKLIYEKTGIRVSPQKQALISNRLRRRLRALSLDCYDKYFQLLCRSKNDDPEWDAFLQEITTHETYLFRDKLHWDWFQNKFLPEMVAEARNGKRQKKLRVWSAASSTGDEAYTIASCIADKIMTVSEWKVEIVGTDIGVDTIAKAKDALFNERAMQLVPDSYKRRFFEQQCKVNIWTPKPVLRNMVQFKQHNLIDPLREAAFDLVVLKNVLIYFDPDSRKRVVDHIRKVVTPGSYLLTGSAEGVAGMLDGFEQIHSWLYRK